MSLCVPSDSLIKSTFVNLKQPQGMEVKPSNSCRLRRLLNPILMPPQRPRIDELHIDYSLFVQKFNIQILSLLIPFYFQEI